MALSLKVKMPAAVRRALDSPRMAALFRPAYPPFAIEVTSRALFAVGVERRGGAVTVTGQREVAVPAGLLQPSLLKPAVTDVDAFRELMRQCFLGMTGFEGSFSLILPDRVAKVTFVELEQAGSSLSETAELIRWKLKRATPFRVEDGRIAFQGFGSDGPNLRFLVSLAHSQVIEQFERVASDLGWQCGLVDLASFNLWNLVQHRLGGDGDSLLLNFGDDYSTAIIARGSVPLFVRCKSPAGGEGVSAEELKGELQPTLLYYQDRIGGRGIRHALVRAPQPLQDELLAELPSRHGIPASAVTLEGIAGLESLGADAIERLVPAVGAACGR